MKNLLTWMISTSIVPLAPKNLRISAILISIYQVLVAHVVLFVMLLGLAHAEEMSCVLSADIQDQKERQLEYEFPTNSNGETLNEIRFKSASQLASVTLFMLYVGTTIASFYLISTLALLVGTLRSRCEYMLPWLILDCIGVILVMAIMIAAANENTYKSAGGKIQYWTFCSALTCFDIIIWFIVHAFYMNLRFMKKLTEVAVVPIPCPPPEAIPQIPYYYRRENMYVGDGGYKHLLSEGDPNYVV